MTAATFAGALWRRVFAGSLLEPLGDRAYMATLSDELGAIAPDPANTAVMREQAGRLVSQLWTGGSHGSGSPAGCTAYYPKDCLCASPEGRPSNAPFVILGPGGMGKTTAVDSNPDVHDDGDALRHRIKGALPVNLPGWGCCRLGDLLVSSCLKPVLWGAPYLRAVAPRVDSVLALPRPVSYRRTLLSRYASPHGWQPSGPEACRTVTWMLRLARAGGVPVYTVDAEALVAWASSLKVVCGPLT